MRRRFFAQSMVRMLSMCLIIVLSLTIMIMITLVPNEKKALENETEINLNLVQENMNLLLNDSNKVMNMLDVPTYSNTNSIYQILQSKNLKYVDFVVLKQLAAQLNAIVNSREYIDSIYLYIPNEYGRYLTNQAHVYEMSSDQDENWLNVCEGEKKYRIIRRTTTKNSTVSKDYLTVIQENAKGYTVAVNIVASYFLRLFTNPYLEEGRSIILSDGDKALFCSNSSLNAQEMVDFLKLSSNDTGIIKYSNNCIIHTYSRNTGLDLISVTPQSILYGRIYRLIFITCITALLCFIISVAFSYKYARNVSGQIYSLLDLIEAAISHKELPQIKMQKSDLYSYIITNMIKTFAENDYLQVSLNEQKYHALSLELSALQYQINPHFLSNTLQMIDFEILSLTKIPTTANEMIQNLSLFLQYSLRLPKEDVTIEQEIEATMHYTSLMESRYNNQVIIHWDIDSKVSTYLIPKLVLQPMIENCITHGFITPTSKLNIYITISLSNEVLTIQVRDDGIGVTPERLDELRNSLTSFDDFHEKNIGLQNLFRRMQLRFEANQCHITLDSQPMKGFCVTIFISISKDSA